VTGLFHITRSGLFTGFVKAAVMLALGYFAAVLLLQRRILFPRPTARGVPNRPDGVVQVWLPTAVGPVEAWYLPPVDACADPAPTIIFFHGNGELIEWLPREFDEPRQWGLGVLLVEFPGYGRSSGSPSESSITSAALAAYDWAHTQAFIDGTRLVAYGRSLGGAAAMLVAAKRTVPCLVLESTFTSVRSFAHQFAVPRFAILDPFDSLALIGTYAGSVLVLHGEHDDLVPIAHGAELARAAKQSRFHVLPCGHNDCVRPWGVIRELLIDSGVLAAGQAPIDQPPSPQPQ
jgi:pimeloyl-ACP methyl ester carboxylesterase